MILNIAVQTNFPSPIYQNESDRYEIDTCEAQFKAMRQGKIELRALSKGHYPGTRINLNILPGLTNVGYWNSRRMQDWGLEAHRNEGLELAFLETGELGFEVDGGKHALHAGQMTVTRPWQLHRLGNPHIGRGRLSWMILDVGVWRPNQEWVWPEWVVLSARDKEELSRKLRQGERSVWVANAAMRQVFRDMAECVVGWKNQRMESRLTVVINRALVELLEMLASQKTVESPELMTRRRTVELFLKDLATNPLSSAMPWSLAEMAEQCGMGVTAMSKYCRELVNNGPMHYLNMCRLDHAASLLRADSDSSITDVALAAGFNSSQYFATCFRRRYQTTPVAYRERAV